MIRIQRKRPNGQVAFVAALIASTFLMGSSFVAGV
jgi:hypothetical protein